MLSGQFDEDEAALARTRGQSSAARTRERVEHDVARFRERLDERPDGNNRLLIGVMQVARVFPGQNIRQRLLGLGRSALGQKKAHFVKALGVALT